ncbi:hypothetical protein [Coleofasciculus sp. FACHB-712]|nr:hypothetical protein [Coleofasciculus sp. FACHB-712]
MDLIHVPDRRDRLKSGYGGGDRFLNLITSRGTVLLCLYSTSF